MASFSVDDTHDGCGNHRRGRRCGRTHRVGMARIRRSTVKMAWRVRVFRDRWASRHVEKGWHSEGGWLLPYLFPRRPREDVAEADRLARALIAEYTVAPVLDPADVYPEGAF